MRKSALITAFAGSKETLNWFFAAGTVSVRCRLSIRSMGEEILLLSNLFRPFLPFSPCPSNPRHWGFHERITIQGKDYCLGVASTRFNRISSPLNHRA